MYVFSNNALISFGIKIILFVLLHFISLHVEGGPQVYLIFLSFSIYKESNLQIDDCNNLKFLVAHHPKKLLRHYFILDIEVFFTEQNNLCLQGQKNKQSNIMQSTQWSQWRHKNGTVSPCWKKREKFWTERMIT